VNFSNGTLLCANSISVLDQHCGNFKLIRIHCLVNCWHPELLITLKQHVAAVIVLQCFSLSQSICWVLAMSHSLTTLDTLVPASL